MLVIFDLATAISKIEHTCVEAINGQRQDIFPIRPIHFLGSLQTCHSPSIHQMPSDLPTGPSHLTPIYPPAHLFLIPQLTPQYLYQPMFHG